MLPLYLLTAQSETMDIIQKIWKRGGNGYEPISLQYRPYTAIHARKESIAGGDPREESNNRTYYGKTAITANESDLDNVIKTKEKMGNKPVIVCIRMKNPAVLSELEPYADAILIDFGVEKRALLDIITGQYEPQGLLPIILPKDMETVENIARIWDLTWKLIPIPREILITLALD
jgi:beta-glucosidase